MNAISTVAALLPLCTGSISFWATRAKTKAAALAAPHQTGRQAGEAADVRRLAVRYMRSDPGFACDLMAAADRHEALSCSEVRS